MQPSTHPQDRLTTTINTKVCRDTEQTMTVSWDTPTPDPRSDGPWHASLASNIYDPPAVKTNIPGITATAARDTLQPTWLTEAKTLTTTMIAEIMCDTPSDDDIEHNDHESFK